MRNTICIVGIVFAMSFFLSISAETSSGNFSITQSAQKLLVQQTEWNNLITDTIGAADQVVSVKYTARRIGMIKNETDSVITINLTFTEDTATVRTIKLQEYEAYPLLPPVHTIKGGSGSVGAIISLFTWKIR